MAGLGDATGDGRADLLLGADLAGPGQEGIAYLVGGLRQSIYLPLLSR
ncbi:MAG TPA: hypothetical protein VGE07_03800 [Herpetosiphonaceae bacterium]